MQHNPELYPAEETLPAQNQTEQPPKPPRRKVRTPWTTVLLALLLAAGLLAGSLWLLVHNGTEAEISLNTGDGVRSFYAQFGAGDGASFGADEEAEDTLPADRFSFFNSYYTGSGEVELERAELNPDVSLEFTDVGDELTLQEVYDTVSPAVVGITTYLNGEEYGWGTGVLFTSDGYIITNEHVLETADRAMVSLADGREFEARLVGADDANDLAVIKIEGKLLPYAEFADSAACRVGDEVVAIGNPLGSQYARTMTNGIISGIDRSVSNNGHTMSLLQTNAALNEGNSGGPLVNMQGQVIGITNMKVMNNAYNAVEGIGFAIPCSVIRTVVNQIMQYGTALGEPTIGIVAGSIPEEAKAEYDLPDGIYVTSVDERSDAYARGLREGDVITAVNGLPVTTVSQVNAIKEGYAVGDTLTVTVYREGETFEITFALVDKTVITD